MTGCLAIVQPVAQGTVLHLIIRKRLTLTIMDSIIIL